MKSIESPISIGVVGGSNSVLRDGYLSYLTRALQDRRGIAAAAPINMAVGGTSCFTGLAVLARTQLHLQVDVLVVEYTLNDTAAFGQRPDMFDDWARAYEGLVRKALVENPRLVLVPVILGQRSGAHRRGMCPIAAGVRNIALRYGLNTADMNEEIALRYSDPEAFAALYADESHFTSPFGAQLVAGLVADKIAESLHHAAGGTARPAESVPPIYANNFAHARYNARPHALFLKPPRQKLYKNSLYRVDTWTLEPGNAISFALSGRVLLFDFVSIRSSGTLKIGLRDGTVLQNTTRATFIKQRNPFLLGTIMPERHGGYSVRGMRQRITIEISERTQSQPNDPEERDEATGPLIPPINPANPSFALAGILYVGVLTPAR